MEHMNFSYGLMYLFWVFFERMAVFVYFILILKYLDEIFQEMR